MENVLDEESEKKIIALLRDGDKQAIVLLYNQFAAVLYAFIYKIVKNKEEAESLVKDCFIQAWKNHHQYDPSKGRLFTWLISNARSLSLPKAKDGAVFISGHKNIHMPDNIHAEHLDFKEQILRVRPEQKDLIDLIFFKGYNHIEAAKNVKIPLGTAKTRLRTAIFELRNIFHTP